MKLLVVHPATPRIEKLTEHLAEDDQLHAVVHPMYSPEWVDTFKVIPFVGQRLAQAARRRVKPMALKRTVIAQDPLREIARALAFRISKRMGQRGERFQENFMYRNHIRLSQKGIALLEGADLVYARSGSALEVFRAAKTRGIPTVLDYPIAHHGFSRSQLEAEMASNPEFASTMQWHEWPDWFEQRMNEEIALADAIHTVSRFAAQTFPEYQVDPGKFIIEPSGVDLSLFERLESGPHHRPFNIIFVGQIGQRKGIGYLLNAYDQFQKPDTSLTLVGNFVGDPQPTRRYSHLYRHIGHVPKWEVPKLLASATVFVLPSLNEGLPLAVMEAMAMGLPVIVTESGADEVVVHGKSGLIVPASNSEAIRSALEQLYSSQSLYEDLSEGAFEVARQLTWRAYKNRLMPHFLELTARLSPQIGK